MKNTILLLSCILGISIISCDDTHNETPSDPCGGCQEGFMCVEDLNKCMESCENIDEGATRINSASNTFLYNIEICTNIYNGKYWSSTDEALHCENEDDGSNTFYYRFPHSSGGVSHSDCRINETDVQNSGCPVIYSRCDNVGESQCCGGNAYNCMQSDTLFNGDASESAKRLFQNSHTNEGGFWIMNDCKAVAVSKCVNDKNGRGAACVLDECTNKAHVEGKYDCNRMTYTEVCAKISDTYEPKKVYCCDYSDGKSYNTVDYVHSYSSTSVFATCTLIGDIEKDN